MYDSTGILRYTQTPEYYRCVVEVDQELADFYRSLVPKHYSIIRQRWNAHITIVRPYNEVPVNLEPWGRYEGEQIDFKYDTTISFGKVYCWLNCYSNRLEDIRSELGLSLATEFEPPAAPYAKRFHMTIGNSK